MDNQLLPKSIEMRAIAHMEKGVEAIEAVKLAIEEENNTIWLAAHGVDMKTGRLRTDIKNKIQSIICKSVYERLTTTKF